MRRWQILPAGLLVVIAAVLFMNTPPRLDYEPPASRDDLALLTTDSVDGLIPGTEKRLTWHDGEGITDWSVVALHGFSATRQESAPLAEIVARHLGANLFETRFTGHGLSQKGLHDVAAEEWLDDAVAALHVGRTVGRRVVVIGVSTGATLATALLDSPGMQAVDALIFLSPNFAPADPKALWITKPGGPLLLRMIGGDTRSWEAHNALQERYWTTRYPSKALVQVVRVVDRAQLKVDVADAPRLQIYFSPDDQVVSVSAIEQTFERFRSPQKELIPVAAPNAPAGHMIVGDIISPQNTEGVANKITAFVLRQSP